MSQTVHRSHGITIQRGRAPPVYLGWEAAHGEKNGISSYIVTRLTIVNHIREQCEILYSDRITFADGHGLVGGDLPQGAVRALGTLHACHRWCFIGSVMLML